MPTPKRTEWIEGCNTQVTKGKLLVAFRVNMGKNIYFYSSQYYFIQDRKEKREMKKNLTSLTIAETAPAASMRWVFAVPTGTVFCRPTPFLVRR